MSLLLVTLLALIFFAANSAQWTHSLHLANGSVLSLQQFDHGRSHYVLVKGNPLSKQLSALRKGKAFHWNFGPITLSSPHQYHFHTDTNSILLWFKTKTDLQKQEFQSYIRQNVRAVLKDSTGKLHTNIVSGLLFDAKQPPIFALHISPMNEANIHSVHLIERTSGGFKPAHRTSIALR